MLTSSGAGNPVWVSCNRSKIRCWNTSSRDSFVRCSMMSPRRTVFVFEYSKSAAGSKDGWWAKAIASSSEGFP